MPLKFVADQSKCSLFAPEPAGIHTLHPPACIHARQSPSHFLARQHCQGKNAPHRRADPSATFASGILAQHVNGPAQGLSKPAQARCLRLLAPVSEPIHIVAARPPGDLIRTTSGRISGACADCLPESPAEPPKSARLGAPARCS